LAVDDGGAGDEVMTEVQQQQQQQKCMLEGRRHVMRETMMMRPLSPLACSVYTVHHLHSVPVVVQT
jgi:hypothetical protein